MSEIRAGGHVIGDHGWEVLPVDEVREVEAAPAPEPEPEPEFEPELSMDNSKAELLEAAEGLDVDESNTKAEILEALEG